MKVRDYLKNFGKFKNVAFIEAIAREDGYKHAEYRVTPMRSIEEWENSKILDYYILNDKQPPIDWLSGSSWLTSFNKGLFLSLLVINEENFIKLYADKEQREELIKFIDEKIMESLKDAKE